MFQCLIKRQNPGFKNYDLILSVSYETGETSRSSRNLHIVFVNEVDGPCSYLPPYHLLRPCITCTDIQILKLSSLQKLKSLNIAQDICSTQQDICSTPSLEFNISVETRSL